MAHLRDRLCLIPFCDLTDSPEAGHHAIGSPYFDAVGKPLFPDPIIIAIRADIADEALPRCKCLAVSCSTRPYHSYGPVMRRIFEMSQPHNYPQVRLGMEGVMELGEVREIFPGGLSQQTDSILLGCVSSMTAGTNFDILRTVLQNFAAKFTQTPAGSTLRMPLIGTGTARTEEATDKLFRQVMHMTISYFLGSLLPLDIHQSTRRLLLVHPLEYESSLIAKMIYEKAIFLTILDKMGITTTDRRLIYGLGHGTKPQQCFVEEANFHTALDFFDQALDQVLQGNRKLALQLAAKGAEVEPALGSMYLYLHSLTTQKTGLIEEITHEALSLAANGRVKDAYCVAQALNSLGIGKKETTLINSLKDCYLDTCAAALESRLLYENYMKAQEALDTMQKTGHLETSGVDSSHCIALAESDMQRFQQIGQKIPMRLIENTFHIVIRKLLADEVEPSGARRAMENLLELQKLGKIHLSEQEDKVAHEIYNLSDWIMHNKEGMSSTALHKMILEKLLELLPKHGTLRLEAGRYYLKGEDSSPESRAITLTRNDVLKAWEHLQIGHQDNPRDYGILSYIGFIIFMQGPKYLALAEEFFMLFGKLVEYELSQGKYGIRELRSPEKEIIRVTVLDPYTQKAYEYYQHYKENAQNFANLAKTLSRTELTASLNAYQRSIQGLCEIGRYDLFNLYEKILGQTWVALLCRNQQFLGSISIPILGEISIDLVVNLSKKIRRWWKYHSLQVTQIRPAIKALLEQINHEIAGQKK